MHQDSWIPDFSNLFDVGKGIKNQGQSLAHFRCFFGHWHFYLILKTWSFTLQKWAKVTKRVVKKKYLANIFNKIKRKYSEMMRNLFQYTVLNYPLLWK